MSVIARITARLLLGSKRSVAIGLVLLLPVLIAIVFRFSDEYDTSDHADFAYDLVSSLVLGLLLPIVALVLGTTALGTEIEDGTAVFLLSKPIARWRVLVVKAAVAGLAAAAVAVPATVATAWISIGSPSEGGIVVGGGLAALVASIVYSVLFVTLTTLTSRALVIGLIYVFVWEAVLGNLFSGMAWLSVREYSLGVAGAAMSFEGFDPDLGVAGALVAAALVVAGALWWGSSKLTSFEIGERA